MKLDILYEDNHVIGVYKEPGILSQRDIRDVPSLQDHVKEYIKKKYNKQGAVFLGIVHRLDSNVSGIMIFARTSKAASRLHESMLQGKIKKFYIAVVHKKSHIAKGWHLLEDNMQKIFGGSKITNKTEEKTKFVSLSYKCMHDIGQYAILCIALHTGRKHQIRAQLSARGMSIVGDSKYGSSEPNAKAIMLHAIYLQFPHPVKDENIELVSEIPERFSKYEKEKCFAKENILDIIHGFNI